MQEMISNIFAPLFEVTLSPETDPFLDSFLQNISGFDSVDDESRGGRDDPTVLPVDWTSPDNPSYKYYSYYIWANITVLNQLRRARGFSTFDFRPHCGEAGNITNIDVGFLLADRTYCTSKGVGCPSQPLPLCNLCMTQLMGLVSVSSVVVMRLV